MPELVEITKIKIGSRFREDIGDVTSLAASIEKHGLLHPLVIDTENNLIAGRRRMAACGDKLNWTMVPCTRIDVSNELGRRQAELVENVERKDLTWQEEVRLKAEIDRIQKALHGDKEGAGIKGDKWSLRKTAELLGEGVSNTSRDVSLAEALDLIPELGACSSKGEAQRKFAKLVETVAMTELQHRAATSAIKTDEEQVAVKADLAYIVGDAFDGMMHLHDTIHNFVLAEVDPPYGIDLPSLRQAEMDESYKEIDPEDYQRFTERAALHIYNLLANNAWCVWWHGQTHASMVLAILRKTGFFVDEVPAIWVKQQGQTNQPDKYFARAWEGFYLCRKGAPVMHKRGRINVFTYPGVPSQKRIHDTERPIELMLDIVQTLCPPASGEVLVPFLGSGNTLRAAFMNGMNGIGWDIKGESTKLLFTARLVDDMQKVKEAIALESQPVVEDAVEIEAF